MHAIDLSVQTFLSGIRSPGLTEFMYFLTQIFDVTTFVSALRFVILVLCLIGIIYFVRGMRYGVLFGLALVCGAVVSEGLKVFFGVARPLDGIILEIGKSFPSYHALESTVFFVMLMYIFQEKLKGIWRLIFNTFCLLLVIFVSFSRLYLGVHWLSDVLGGIVFGLVVSFGAIIIYKKYDQVIGYRSAGASGKRA